MGICRLEIGDIIVEINGRRIQTRQECIDAVNRSPEIMEFVLRDGRTGGLFHLRTRLRSGSIRFGVNLTDTGGNGAKVTFLSQGYPCMECQRVR